MAYDKNFYNKAASKLLGWLPTWFGAVGFDEDLIKKIKSWQRKRGLKADGVVGPVTYRVAATEKLSEITLAPQRVEKVYSEHIIHDGEKIGIDWDKVVLWKEDSGLSAKQGNYYDYTNKDPRTINMFVNHWDVCLSSRSCSRALDKSGISVHFCIDNDGTIYQLLDTKHAAWHAGSPTLNRASIGVEISNAYYTKYQETYVKNGFDERPIISGETVHGKNLGDFLGFYPIQLEAMRALWIAINKATGIPFETPTDADGNILKEVNSDASKGNFKGFVSHYHLTTRKIDCAGLDIVKHLNLIKNKE